MSRFLLLLVLAFGLSSCGQPAGTLDATVQLEKALPSSAVATNRVVLYRVLTPAELAGRYGIASTRASDAVVQTRAGTVYRIHLTQKDRQILSRNKPENALVSDTNDFFDRAKPQK